MSETYELAGAVVPTAIGYRKKDVARMCGVTERTIENWVARGWLRSTRIGNTVRIAVDDFRAFQKNMREGVYGQSHPQG